jgi:hypothetical protein
MANNNDLRQQLLAAMEAAAMGHSKDEEIASLRAALADAVIEITRLNNNHKKENK